MDEEIDKLLDEVAGQKGTKQRHDFEIKAVTEDLAANYLINIQFRLN